MKEVFRPEPLTKGEVNPYPEVRGNIFMAENQGKGEVPKTPGPIQQQPSEEPASLERQEVRGAWQKVVGGRDLTPEEEWLARIGISPTAGGEERREVPRMTPEETAAHLERLAREEEGEPGGRVDYNKASKEEIKEEISNAPAVEAAHFSIDLLRGAMRFKETGEMLINRILFKSFEDTTETNPYEINLYAQSNLDTLLGYLSRIDRERYDYYISLKNAAGLFHTMNATIIGGNLEEFIRKAEGINYQHFELMKKIPGVPEVMRLYEQKYQDILARDGRISTEGYQELKQEVEKLLRRLNKERLIKSEFEEERTGETPWKMEDWELRRALNVGRTFFNLTFRAAEQIASGQVPTKPGMAGEKRWASFPQESAVRIMNWIQWMTYRFKIAEPRGGVEFLKQVKNDYFSFLEAKKRKLGINKIITLGGMNVKELEVGAMFGVSGVYSSWRMETMAFSRIRIRLLDSEGKPTCPTIREWLNEEIPWSWNKKQVMVKKEEGGKWVEKKDAKQSRKQSRSAWIEQIKKDSKNQEELLEFLTPLIDNTTIGQGILLKVIVSEEAGSEGVAYQARKRIWEKVAENNLPLMIDYLTKIQYESNLNTQDQIKLRDLKFIKQGDNKENPGFWDEATADGRTRWEVLREKILLDHERKLKEATGIDIEGIPKVEFDDDEERLMGKIKDTGRNLAPQLADIVFPYIPFMNDVPFEVLDYGGPGEEFYKRRSGGDFPSFYKAEGAFVQLVNNPGGLGIEEALRQFDAIVKGIESPQGTKEAQERVYPMFSKWLDWSFTKPGQRQVVYKAIKELLRQPTSVAQKYAGLEAESLDEFQGLKVINTALKIGIISPDLAKDMRKGKRLTLFRLIWALFRDFFVMSLIVGGSKFGEAIIKEKK